MSGLFSFQRNSTQSAAKTFQSINDMIASYSIWLSSFNRRGNTGERQQHINAYMQNALLPIKIRGQELSAFAPFRRKYSALQTFTPGQIIFFALLLFAIILSFFYYGTSLLVFFFALISVLYFSDFLFIFLLTLRTFYHVEVERIDDAIVKALAHADWPRYTILCPLYREVEVVPQFVQAMQSLDYPADKLQILLLTEEVDVETRNRLKEMQLPPHFSVITVPNGKPRTKPRACNFGLLQATGDYVVIYDAEDIPDPLQLKKAVLTFANHPSNVVCVQARLNFYNVMQNLLTRWFAAEYSLWFDLLLPGLQSLSFPLPLGGTSNHFRTDALRTLGGWDAFNVTEDCDLGLRLADFKWKTVMLDSITHEEANPHLKNWIRQRSRWIKGYMQTYLVNMRRPARYLLPRNWGIFLFLQVIIGGKIITPFINPLMWGLLISYLIGHTFAPHMYDAFFPSPIFYLSAFCFIFGNFFYMYSHVIACLRHRQYSVIKWTFFLPFYWLFMSISACIAFFQLIFKPHYWEKTQHGLHLHTSTSILLPAAVTNHGETFSHALLDTQVFASPREVIYEAMRTMPLQDDDISSFSTAKMHSMSDVSTFSMPAIVANDASRKRRSSWPRLFSDPWLLLLCAIACIASVFSLYHFFQAGQILTFKDSYSHLLIARRVLDNVTPGLAQLGGVWLPLPHILMLPFIWHDDLWRTGLAGSFVSMPCYVIASAYLFLSARRITGSNLASVAGSLLFVLNPNVLYLQTTPLSEMVLIATTMAACYYFLAWVQEDKANDLILCAFTVFLASLSRYDGWSLLIMLVFAIVVVGLLKRRDRPEIEGNLLAFCSLGTLGILLWLAWCMLIFGDPLYFQHSLFSAQADQLPMIQAGLHYTYHDFWQSIRFFTLAFVENTGIFSSTLFFISLFSFLTYRTFLIHRSLSPEMIACFLFAAPILFYILSLFLGQAALLLPAAVPSHAPDYLHTKEGLYNLRFAVEALPFAAFFVSLLIHRLSLILVVPARPWPEKVRSFWALLQALVLVLPRTLVFLLQTILPFFIRSFLIPVILLYAILAQQFVQASQNIVLVQEGLYGLDCSPPNLVASYLAQHYDGGLILEHLYTSREAGVDFKNIVYEGSGPLWQAALKNPAAVVNWVILNPFDKDDMVAENINLRDGSFLSQFIPVLRDPSGIILFHRKDLPPTPIQISSENLSSPSSTCRFSTPRHIRPLKNLSSSSFQPGIVFPRWAENAYGKDDISWLRALPAIRSQTSARWIEMPILFAQESLASTTVTTGDGTPSLEAFAYGIRAAHAQGYRVYISPILTIKGPIWSGFIKYPTERLTAQWFDSYWHALQPYLEVAAQEKVEQFSLGTEYELLEQTASPALWNTLIARARKVFPGTLTYNMNWSSLKATSFPGWMRNPELALLGVSTYVPLAENQNEIITLRSLTDLWAKKVKPLLITFAEQTRKPLILSEVGFRRTADALYRTWEPYSLASWDQQLQAYAYHAVLANIMHDPHFRGAFFWGWDNVGQFSIENQPAALVLHSWYASLNF